MQAFDRLIRVIERAWIFLAALMLLAIMLGSTLDVVMRYFFNAPIGPLYDLISFYLMPGVFFFALADTLHGNEHVCVDLLHTRMSPRVRHACLLLGYALVALIFAFMTWAAFSRMAESLRAGDVVAGAIAWPTWITSLFVTLGFVAIWLRVLHRLAGHAASVVSGRSVIALPPISGTQEAV